MTDAHTHHDHAAHAVDPAEHQHEYDLPYHWTGGEFYREVARVAGERVAPVVRGRRVLEMGCGDGFLTAQMAPVADRIFAFDMNERAIAFAGLIVRDPNVGFGTGRAEDLAAMAKHLGEVDVVASFEVIEHLSSGERDAFLAAALEVLAPRHGSLIFTTPNGSKRPGHTINPHHAHEFTPAELRTLVRDTGFVDVRIEGLYLQPPWDRLEHFSQTVPFRAGFRRLARAGRNRPEWCRTLICVARVP